MLKKQAKSLREETPFDKKVLCLNLTLQVSFYWTLLIVFQLPTSLDKAKVEFGGMWATLETKRYKSSGGPKAVKILSIFTGNRWEKSEQGEHLHWKCIQTWRKATVASRVSQVWWKVSAPNPLPTYSSLQVKSINAVQQHTRFGAKKFSFRNPCYSRKSKLISARKLQQAQKQFITRSLNTKCILPMKMMV